MPENGTRLVHSSSLFPARKLKGEYDRMRGQGGDRWAHLPVVYGGSFSAEPPERVDLPFPLPRKSEPSARYQSKRLTLTQTLKAMSVQPPTQRRAWKRIDWLDGKERKDQANHEYETKSLGQEEAVSVRV